MDRLRQQLREAETSLRNARIAAAPVKAGDVVTDHRGKVFRVCGVTPRSWGFDVQGHPQKKDGTFGSAWRHVYDWKLAEPAAPPEQPARAHGEGSR